MTTKIRIVQAFHTEVKYFPLPLNRYSKRRAPAILLGYQHLDLTLVSYNSRTFIIMSEDYVTNLCLSNSFHINELKGSPQNKEWFSITPIPTMNCCIIGETNCSQN
ncbi:hypothetical protein V8G54_020756 [Vigna mungo]|uniref:Uncharacterized protein n=1 Tax=Vigna mungo TaxID=3915 RepID=A0AAQ3NC77_VIGMU